MDRKFESGASLSVPTVPAAPSTGYATNGDPATAIQATVPGEYWYHMVTEELRHLVVSAGLTPAHATLTQVYDAVAAMIAAGSISVPVGGLVPFAGGTVHNGFLKCNGAGISRTTYAALFAEIGIIYGAGNGSTTFNLPDLRGEFLRGWDDARGVDPGRPLGGFQGDDFKSHTHITAPSFAGAAYGTAFYGAVTPIPDDAGPTSATGGIETRPRNLAVQFLIKY